MDSFFFLVLFLVILFAFVFVCFWDKILLAYHKRKLTLQSCIIEEFFPSSSSATSSCSSNPTISQGKYDVFLSFRGEDTRNNFTSHLLAALEANKIKTFIDYNLERGEEISPSLLKAIEESKISVVILSQDYASSKWCLEELVKILECRKNNQQIVIPVFHQVDPSLVRKQTGAYKVVFAQYEKCSLVGTDKVKRWRAALRKVANISGRHSTVNRAKAKIIKEIIGDVLSKLNKISPVHHSKSLVGIEPRIQEVESLLSLESMDVRFVGKWGMGGLGKTTLARAIYDQISSQFESCFFLSNTREKLQRCTFDQLREELFSALLENESLTTTSIFNIPSPLIQDRLCRRKVLIVLDDVVKSPKLKDLLLSGDGDMFGLGSRILLTSRDRQVLKNIARDRIYEMQKLEDNEAIQLFSLNAFKQDFLSSDYASQSKRVIKYADGNPLALKVLGCALFDRSADDWESMLQSLGTIQDPDIHNVLRSSYDALDVEVQSMFLDIACIFRGKPRDHITNVLDCCYTSVHFRITTLIDRSLITISSDGKLEMHDLLQEMGRTIVLDESRNPENRSRLWKPEDIFYVLKENKGTQVTEGISFDMSEAEQIRLEPDTFVRMCRLRFLNFYGKVQLLFDNLESLPNELRYLHWTKFPMKSLPSNFSPQNLVVLNLPDSNVKELWRGKKNLASLKEIDLSWSKYLTRIPDLTKALNLEKINLRGCGSLEEVHPSIQYLNKLIFLNLLYCSKLKRLPRRFDSKVIIRLYIYDCNQLEEGCLDFQGNDQLEELYLNCRAVKDVQSTISSILLYSPLKDLNLHNCGKLSSLPSSFHTLTSLEFLGINNFSELECFPEVLEPMHSLSFFKLTNCRNLKRLPNSICNLKSVRYLYLDGSGIKEIPSSIEHLQCLTTLSLKGCKYLESLPELPPSLEVLHANNCKSLETVSITFRKHRYLSELNFGNCLKLDLKALVLEAQYHIAEVNFFRLLYPGSEVPKWFSHQSMGSSSTQRFPSNQDQFDPASYCLVFEITKPISIKSTDFYRFKANFTDGRYSDRLLGPLFASDICIMADTDHVGIEIGNLDLKDRILTSWDIYRSDFYGRNLGIAKHCKVKAWGVTVIQKTLFEQEKVEGKHAEIDEAITEMPNTSKNEKSKKKKRNESKTDHLGSLLEALYLLRDNNLFITPTLV